MVFSTLVQYINMSSDVVVFSCKLYMDTKLGSFLASGCSHMLQHSAVGLIFIYTDSNSLLLTGLLFCPDTVVLSPWTCELDILCSRCSEDFESRLSCWIRSLFCVCRPWVKLIPRREQCFFNRLHRKWDLSDPYPADGRTSMRIWGRGKNRVQVGYVSSDPIQQSAMGRWQVYYFTGSSSYTNIINSWNIRQILNY